MIEEEFGLWALEGIQGPITVRTRISPGDWKTLKPNPYLINNKDNNPFNRQESGDHYKKLKIEPVEYIHKNEIGYLEGSAIKYLSRWKNKGGIRDLLKAKHFIELLIFMEENKEVESE